jgi:hypothetical protein
MKAISLSIILVLSTPAFAGVLPTHSSSAVVGNVTTEPDMVGRVTNSNGIRDDVNQYVLVTFAEAPQEQIAAIRFAQANQRILEVIAEDRPVTQELVTKIAYAGQCLAQRLDKRAFLKQAREITARTFDTEARFRAHDDFSKQAYGMSVATSDEVDACEASQQLNVARGDGQLR